MCLANETWRRDAEMNPTLHVEATRLGMATVEIAVGFLESAVIVHYR